MDDMKMVRAKKVYEDLCAVLDSKNWRYTKKEDKLIVELELCGEDIPMRFLMMVDVSRQLLRVLSPMPFNFKQDKLVDGAIAACVASYGLPDGSFDYDIKSGCLFFKQTVSFIDTEVGQGLIEYIVYCSSCVVDEYNDKFMALNNGIISISDFVSKY